AAAARAILAGHVILSRDLAAQGHYPAIDVLYSVSRVMIDVVRPEHMNLAQKVKSIIASYKKVYDLISIGAYKEGSDPKVDHAIKTIDRINNYLRQDMGDKTDFDDSVQALFSLAV
ncbi:MAG: hypothetical protein HZB21_04135, partial [Deltaproteobacteria bacterium]|nr:hypothetical protein [Deltaproteobacteria bacterium]